ncbi:MAG TPA: hypothetical protein VGD37_26710 [Kofleriaceae bacterium]|jgi:hypothetical protein
MIEPAISQEPERLRPGALWTIGVAIVVITAGLVAIAWWLVLPPSAAERAAAAPSPLERVLFDRANAGDDVRAAGERRLEGYDWIDRRAGVIRIPIDRAIDAVVADPRLIRGTRAAPGAAVGEIGQ